VITLSKLQGAAVVDGEFPRGSIDQLVSIGRVLWDPTEYRVSVLTPSDGKWRKVLGIGPLGCERKCSTEKENLMASPTTFRSPYVQRLELVKDTIVSHSKLGDKAAGELAGHILDALNSIPEKVR
jgi:Family of unknown function (DUF6307)